MLRTWQNYFAHVIMVKILALVSQRYSNKAPKNEWLKRTKIYWLTVLEARS